MLVEVRVEPISKIKTKKNTKVFKKNIISTTLNGFLNVRRYEANKCNKAFIQISKKRGVMLYNPVYESYTSRSNKYIVIRYDHMIDIKIRKDNENYLSKYGTLLKKYA